MVEYIEAIGRNPGEEKNHSHLYEVTSDGLLPMCIYGWNRSYGERFSIFRGWLGEQGTCAICVKRRKAGLSGLEIGRHKTRYL